MTRARWRLAEERLYPLALSDTEAYQRALQRVGRVLAELRVNCHSVEDLLDVDNKPVESLSAGSAEQSDDFIDARTVVEAACALRLVELAAQGAHTHE
ncbi:hypothetical protein [Streptomyces chiangmaiensis]|uniref:Uncharacterized protein n=1 Tax=Streptomyces chiangmaiensis TaxID=766497 RepID=A0ABU7FMA2_9ACTN|nr:hypothetical protein [Streptomyces chiangmaiensis]MED7824812.1 hypothetical protein [Streptomyces chiangmaiensis]